MATKNVWQSVCDPDNFMEAWRRVRANLGAPGVDRVSIEDFERQLDSNLSILQRDVREETYKPLPLLEFQRPKKSGTMRELKIPAVRDRVVQEALLLQLSPIFEPMFLDCSYAYRPRRSAKKAVERVMRAIRNTFHWIVDADIENFFNNVDRDILFSLLQEKIADSNILNLLRIILDDAAPYENKGIPQGAAISPLLSNIYLHVLDGVMVEAEYQYIRYADDLVLLCQTEQQAPDALTLLTNTLQEKLNLPLNTEKTRIIHIRSGLNFLGYHFTEQGMQPGGAAIDRIHANIEKAMNKAPELTERDLQAKLESIVRGWLNYFHLEQTDKHTLFKHIENKLSDQAQSLPLHVLSAALALQTGRNQQAHQIVEQAPPDDIADPEMSYQWGIICDMTHRPGEAIDAYLNAYRLNENHPEAAYRIGLHYLQSAQTDRAIRFLQKAVQISPDNAHVHYALAMALQSMALHGAAQKSFARAFHLDPTLATPVNAKSEPPAETSTGYATDKNADSFSQCFNGREGVYARQWIDNRGRLGYSPVHHTITQADFKAHLAGDETLGLYLLRADNTVYHLIIDIDILREKRAGSLTNTPNLEFWNQTAQRDAQQIVKAASDLGLTGFIEDSGQKGRHIWFFFAEPVPAHHAITLGKKLLEQTTAANGLSREIFPKETRIHPQALGSMIKLPWGIHKLTNRRCYFLDDSGQPYTNPADWFESIRTVTTQQLQAAFEQLKITATPSRTSAPDTTQVDNMIEKCNVLKYLVDKAQREHHLTHTDRLTLLHTIGHLKEPGQFMIHQIIRHTLNYDQRITERWIRRLKGSPVSCPKIRTWQRQITPSVGCFCKFPQNERQYPTPILHVRPNFKIAPPKKQASTNKPSAASPVAPKLHSSSQQHTPSATTGLVEQDVSALVDSYVQVRRQSKELETRRTSIEHQLEQLFGETGRNQIELSMGTLRRVREGEHVRWVIEI
ncbi:group II intron reverse transcriptase/maturase [candidate division KSB1 bacterium]|nr:group II intron reverse transcriptase/maturase [candidate division KSB1 bacterium]